MKQESMIKNMPQAFDFVEQMGLSEDWEAGYRVIGRRALGEILEGQMRDRVTSILRRGPLKRVRPQKWGFFNY